MVLAFMMALSKKVSPSSTISPVNPISFTQSGAKDWTTYAKRKGLTDKGLTGPAAQLAAALATAKKAKK